MAPSDVSRTVAFRLPPDYREKLEEKAAQLHLTPGAYVRTLVTSHLDREAEDTGAIRDALDGLGAEVSDNVEHLQAELVRLTSELIAVREQLSRLASQEGSSEEERLSAIETELLKVRRDVANGILQLLVQGKPMTAQQANAWAKEHMPP